jgi:hypothetical protein
MRVIVTGHPRSGTGYTAHCFRCAGWDVGHEKVGSDGISSWMWAVKSTEVPWGTPRNVYPGATTELHIMREPAAAISSIAYVEQSTEAWRAQWIAIPFDACPVERAIWSYLGWNLLILAQAPTHSVQLEHVEAKVSEITGEQSLEIPKGYRNDRLHTVLSADQIKATPWRHPITAQLWERVNAIYDRMAP